jgi:hypothetical protein
MTEQEQWTVRDVIWGGVFLCGGLLAVAYGVLARRNGVPVALWGGAWFVGTILIALGANAIYKGIRAARQAGRPANKLMQTDADSRRR